MHAYTYISFSFVIFLFKKIFTFNFRKICCYLSSCSLLSNYEFT
jgi:hypothetical protein